MPIQVSDGVFVNCRSSFIVTDDLKVTSNSIDVIMNVLKDLGYTGYSDLQETLVDVGFEEVTFFFSLIVVQVIALNIKSSVDYRW